MNFRASFCDPFNPNIIDLGQIQKETIIDKFLSIDWSDYLRKMESPGENKIYYSPSLEIENIDTKHGLSISTLGDPNSFGFYIFYKRPKKVKGFLGLRQKMNENYVSDKIGQTKQDALDCLNALISNDTDYLVTKIG